MSISSESKKCRGCGSILQTENPGLSGYCLDLQQDYCQRCFRMRNYDQHTDTEVPPMTDLTSLEQLQGRFFWIIDIMDLETSLHSQFVEFFQSRECRVIVNKCDLLPKMNTVERLEEYLQTRFSELGIRVIRFIYRGMKIPFIEQFREAIKDSDEQMIFVGMSNVGKSTVINHLMKENILTVNRHPSTTLNLNYLQTGYGTIVDSVGLVASTSIQAYLNTAELKAIVPNRQVDPVVYQLRGSQSLAIGGFCRIDIRNCKGTTAVVYGSKYCNVNRGKISDAERLWNRNYGSLLKPAVSKDWQSFRKAELAPTDEKRDICISGYGWVCISGEYDGITVHYDRNIEIYERKAMI